ncbi:MAG: envelope stress response membrane protein PspB [Robiginitomaculum sp.]|nr:envelope stress response membrane protein PspB [Robiginitomaculum sp.]MDQ7078819.1 envelope stress response membrane protein PspB [Robiginitomaculum sp.]
MDITVIAVVFIVLVIMPSVILSNLTKLKQQKSLSADDEHMLEDLWRSARRMEKRINSLEAILDAETPGWRTKEDE